MATEEQTIADDSSPQQVDGQISEQLGIDAPDSTYSLELSQDQKDIRDWAHGFAEQTVRPAAHEWDEKEEFPWPVVQEAAKIGLYGFESIAQFWADPSGLTFPIVNEELFWGDAGIGMSIFGTTLAVAGIFGSGTPEQLVEWVPQCFGDENDVKVGAFCASEPDAGLRCVGLPHHRQVRRGQGRVGDQRPEGLGDQRRHRQRPRGDRLGRPRAGLARPRRLRHPPGHEGPRAGRQGEEARHPRLPYRRRPPGRLPRPRLLPAGRQGEARRAARQGPRGQELQGPGGDADLRALAPDGRRAGGRHRPRRL